VPARDESSFANNKLHNTECLQLDR